MIALDKALTELAKHDERKARILFFESMYGHVAEILRQTEV
jgi:hypothetical protein